MIQLKDSIYGKTFKKKRTYKDLSASGNIENSLYLTLEEQGKDPLLTYYLSDIYAWTIDYLRLDNGYNCLLYTSPSTRDVLPSSIPSSA